MKKKTKILVTGSNGQLGKSIRDLEKRYSNCTFYFKSAKELDITDKEHVKALFHIENYDYCINCAAYTAVDKAEQELERAFLVNAEAVKYFAESCKESGTILIHISTDFVFDGNKTIPYTEEDSTNPINVYGASKLKGEEYISEILNNFFIIRTSWVYSEYGNNFVKTMLRLANEKNEIGVVNDQFGSPTFAGDLAQLALIIATSKSENYGIYHYSNEGEISWCTFAIEIFKQNNIKTIVNPVKTEEYLTLAKRPSFSVMDNSKIKSIFGNKLIFNWKESLKKVRLKND